MPKFNIGKLIATFFALEQIHFTVKRFVPPYSRLSDHVIKNIKRKIGLKKTLWDDVSSFIGEPENLEITIFNTNAEEIDYLIAEQTTFIERIQIPRESASVLSFAEAPAHIKTALMESDIPSKVPELWASKSEIGGMLLEGFPYVLGSCAQGLDPSRYKSTDPSMEKILRSRKRIAGWNDILHLKFGDEPIVVIRDVPQDLVTLAFSAFQNHSDIGSTPTEAQNSLTPKSSKKRHIILSRNTTEIKNKILQTFPRIEVAYNYLKGCVSKIDLFLAGRPIVADQNESIKLRLIQREIDMNVYPAEVRTAVFSDVMQFVNRSLMKESGKLDSRRSYLFVGPPGCGKTKLISCILGELPLDMTALIVNRDTIGDLSALNVRYPHIKPLAIIIEDIDIMVARSNERQILMNFLDGMFSEQKMITIMTANNPKILGNSFIKRPGRIDRIIEIKPGDLEVRTAQINKLLCGRETEMPAEEIAKLTEGFSFAQQREIVNRAALYSSNDDRLESQCIIQASEECKIQFLNNPIDEYVEEENYGEGWSSHQPPSYPYPEVSIPDISFIARAKLESEAISYARTLKARAPNILKAYSKTISPIEDERD